MDGLQLNIVENHMAAILKVTKLQIARLLPTATKDMQMKFEIEIPKQAWARVWKPKIPIWLPGGHFENDVAENQ